MICSVWLYVHTVTACLFHFNVEGKVTGRCPQTTVVILPKLYPKDFFETLLTGKVQCFLCEKWFAVDEGDGRVERELVALDNSVTFMQV